MLARESIELWMPSKSFPNLEVSNRGRVRVLKSIKKVNIGRELAQRKDKDGYLIIGVNRTTARVHRLVAESFIPNPVGDEVVHHKDNVKSNNDASNLEWTTVSYNTKHAYHMKVIRSPEAKYVEAIINGETFSHYESCFKCAKAFGSGRDAVEKCVSTGEKYFGFIELKEVDAIPEGADVQKRLFTENPPKFGFKPHRIHYSNGEELDVSGTSDLGYKFNIHRSQATRILNEGKYWDKRGIVAVYKISKEEYLKPYMND